MKKTLRITAAVLGRLSFWGLRAFTVCLYRKAGPGVDLYAICVKEPYSSGYDACLGRARGKRQTMPARRWRRLCLTFLRMM